MTTKYRISSRQRKELYVRCRALQIALPLDGREAEDADPLALARRMLPEVDAEDIVAAEFSAVRVPRQTQWTSLAYGHRGDR